MRIFKNLYLTYRFFITFLAILFLFVLSFTFKALFFVSQVALIILAAFTVLDTFILFQIKKPLKAKRKHTKVLSLGDDNTIQITLISKINFTVKLKIIDELPEQLQERNFRIKTTISPSSPVRKLKYSVNPKSRGIYCFGNIDLFFSSFVQLAERRVIMYHQEDVPVYPSILQMKNFELMAFTSISRYQGIKKIRRIGHSYEFEQIKQYIPGDDTRSVNWKASSRSANLMVNQYEDERSQPVYCIIDKSRSMRMPFNNLSLLDYAINTSLVISNVVLKKYDNAGLMTFSNKLGTFLKAEKNSRQLNKILQNLYHEKVNWPESDFELLYSAVRSFIRGRSLLFLFTNFESTYALERVLPLLRKLNQLHLLVIMFFENSELISYAEKPCHDLLDINQQTAAKELILHKEQILHILKMHGIQAIKTTPDRLSLDTVNKYLELKARGFI
jgi:uncharacterized protein (DUF58 family)